MTTFVQPQNREADLQAILEGYEDRIGHSDWLTDALVKDGVQNSWDARIPGLSWYCKIFLKKLKTGERLVGILDKGTAGLTGSIPQDLDDVVQALQSDDPSERLAYFSSSNWSKKVEDALGSRGRGKMVFVGSSKDREIYFDSVRSDDKKYVLGKTYLDANKAISVDIFEGDAAKEQLRERFSGELDLLEDVGTRILIPNPADSIVDSFETDKISELISHTWWEILHKYNAHIDIEKYGVKNQISPSEWLPVKKLEIEETEEYEDIPLSGDKTLRVKRISLVYLGDKEVPDLYKGLTIQRNGMVVQQIPVMTLINDNIGNKIFGSVELDKKLEKIIRQSEGPEHYTIAWNREVPRQLRQILREKCLEFAKKYKLIEEEKENASRKQRRAELEVQKEINEFVRKLGFTGTGFDQSRRKKHKREEDEPIRISVPDFMTPFPNGRVNFGQSLTGAYAIPINETKKNLKVLVRVYLVQGDRTFSVSGRDFKVEKELELKDGSQTPIGWESLEIDKTFSPGQYSFRAKMVVMERFEHDGKTYEKGDEIYRTLSKTFFVEEDPPDKGMFKVQRIDSNDEKKYYWWEFEDRTWVIYYNGRHPAFKGMIEDENDEEQLHNELRKWTFMIALSIICSEDSSLVEEKKKPRIFSEDSLLNSPFDGLLQDVIQLTSKFNWKS